MAHINGSYANSTQPNQQPSYCLEMPKTHDDDVEDEDDNVRARARIYDEMLENLNFFAQPNV